MSASRWSCGLHETMRRPHDPTVVVCQGYVRGEIELSQHFAIDHKAFLVRQGCDVESKEFHVEVEEETKEQQYSETVEA